MERENYIVTNGDVTIEINWKKISNMPLNEQLDYFNKLARKILEIPVQNGVTVYLDGKEHAVEEIFSEALKLCYSEYKKVYYKIRFDSEGVNTIEVESSRINDNIVNTKEKTKNFTSTNIKNGIILTSILLSFILAAGSIYLNYNNKVSEKNEEEDIKPHQTEEIEETEVSKETSDVIGISSSNISLQDSLFYQDIQNKSAEHIRKILDDAQAQKLGDLDEMGNLIDSYLEDYSLYFNLDSSKVIQIARTKTNNYKDGFETVLGDSLVTVDSDNLEAVSMIFVRQIMRNKLDLDLREFGMTLNDLKLSHRISTIPYDQKLLMRSGETYSQFLGRISDILGIDKNYALAISFYETDEGMKSLCREKNNYGGLEYDGIYLAFPSPEAGIIAHCYNLLVYSKYDIKSWEEMAEIYSEDDKFWLKGVQNYYNQILERESEYFSDNNIKENKEEVTYTISPKN